MWGTIGSIVGSSIMYRRTGGDSGDDPVQTMAQIRTAINFNDLMQQTKTPAEAGKVEEIPQTNIQAFDTFLNQALTEMLRSMRG